MSSLQSEINIKIRFSETDAMGVVWHGNYLKFFEDGREYFGVEHGLEYLDMYHNGYFTPIVKSNIDHKATVKYGEEISIKTTLIPTRSAKIIFKYEVLNISTNKMAALGSTTQVFLNAKTEMLELNKPSFFEAWEKSKKIIT